MGSSDTSWASSAATGSTGADSGRGLRSDLAHIDVPRLRSWPRQDASISAVVPLRPSRSHSLILSRPYATTGWPLLTDELTFSASRRQQVIVTNDGSSSTYSRLTLSQRRTDEAVPWLNTRETLRGRSRGYAHSQDRRSA